MLTTLIVFSLLTYGLAFLIADAKIFGCSTMAYLEDPTDKQYIENAGTLKIRQVFLRFKFFQDLFSCYFCLGVWCGFVIHLLLVVPHIYGHVALNSYFLLSYNWYDTLLGGILAAILGGPVCYMLDLIVDILEKKKLEMMGK